jgi:peptidoglycan/LPS O-acetylase OafA/YrhL
VNEPIVEEGQPASTSMSLARSKRSLFFLLLYALLVISLLGCAVLLLFDLFPRLMPTITHGPVSAIPLLLIGVAYLGLQVQLRPRPLELVKRIMLASAFILWGIDQLLPLGSVATTLGDVVIVLYIIDLILIMRDALRTPQKD